MLPIFFNLFERMFKMNIKLLERSNIVEHDSLGRPVIFQLKFVQMLGESEYYYNFKKVVQEDDEFFDTNLPIIIDSPKTLNEICNQPMQIWDYLYNIYNNKRQQKRAFALLIIRFLSLSYHHFPESV